MPSVQDSLDIDFFPSLRQLADTELSFFAGGCPDTTDVVAFLAATEDDPPADGWSWDQLKELGFSGETGQTILFPVAGEPSNMLVGIGDAADADLDQFAEAGAACARTLGKQTNACVNFEGRATNENAKAFVEGFLLARYSYSAFTSDKDGEGAKKICLSITGIEIDEAEGNALLGRARAYAKATYIARDLTNAPPGHLNPTTFAQAVVQAGGDFGFETNVVELDQLEEMGMGGLVGVNRGSSHPARLVELTYTPETDTSGKVLALVGKGITFDSGGLSLKGAGIMMDMKMDMGGAAAVVGAFSSMADLGVGGKVRGYLAITDNMISGNSLRVGEVLTARNGKTVEVNNTDAEGRLVLMDAISVAVEAKPDWVVDIATLTGAQLVALGTEVAAVIGNDQSLIGAVEAAAERTSEPVWQLPLYKRYLKIMDSKIADLSNANMGTRAAGTITAGLFLSEFAGETPWAHLDIAGPMSSSSNNRWLTPGATGFGARLLLDLSKELGQEG